MDGLYEVMELFKDSTYHFITIHCNTMDEPPSLDGWYQEISKFLVPDKPYILNYEHNPHLHLHAIVAFKTGTIPQSWRNTLTRKYKLKGKHSKGSSYDKQYDHRISKNPVNCSAYILKQCSELNCVSNLATEQLQYYKSLSYEKDIDKKQLFKDNLITYVDDCGLDYKQSFHDSQFRHYTDNEKIKYHIIKYLINNDVSITKSKIESLFIYYRQFSLIDKRKFNAKDYMTYFYS